MFGGGKKLIAEAINRQTKWSSSYRVPPCSFDCKEAQSQTENSALSSIPLFQVFDGFPSGKSVLRATS